MGRRTSSPELRELQEMWVAAVVHGDFDRRCYVAKPKPCWFGLNVPGIDSCEGRIEGAHWVKRQEVARVVGYNLWIPTAKKGRETVFVAGSDSDEQLALLELLVLAEWDARNGVPACHRHHRRFDGQMMPPLVVWRHEVPAHVEAFARDWGLETALEDRNPTLTGGI